MERVRQANQALADELREAQSRAQQLADTNRSLRQQIRTLERRLKAHEGGNAAA